MDSLFDISANLNEMRLTIARYNRAFILANEDSERYKDSDDLEIQTSRIYIAGGMASLILITACAFKDEIDQQYLKYYKHTLTGVIQVKIDYLYRLFEDGAIFRLRNSVLAHNNRIKMHLGNVSTKKMETHYKLVKFWEVDKMIPFRDPEQYADLVLRINDVTNHILSIPIASELNP